MSHPVQESDEILGVAELRKTLAGLFNGWGVAPDAVAYRKLWSPRVYRAQLVGDGANRSLVVKRLSPEIALRNQKVAQRWLPATGLSQMGPPLLATAAQMDGGCVWHIYEDLGDCALVDSDARDGKRRKTSGFCTPSEHCLEAERIEAAVETIAQIHGRFARHPLLAECRLYGFDLGGQFYVSAVRDAIRVLEAVRACETGMATERRESVNRLLLRIQRLQEEQPRRLQALEEFGGPETLLHGDLWPTNVMVYSQGQGYAARLVDWDHAGVGPVSYDLSDFLLHMPREDRQWIMNIYLACLEKLGCRFSPETDWNLLFETAEYARLTNSVIWPALAAFESRADWAFDQLAALDEWFGMLRPALPSPSGGQPLQP